MIHTQKQDIHIAVIAYQKLSLIKLFTGDTAENITMVQSKKRKEESERVYTTKKIEREFGQAKKSIIAYMQKKFAEK